MAATLFAQLGSACEDVDTRFRLLLGTGRGGGVFRTNSILPRPGKEGILDVLFSQLRHDVEVSRENSRLAHFVVLSRYSGDSRLTISSLCSNRGFALSALGVVTGPRYVINLERMRTTALFRSLSRPQAAGPA